MALKARKSVIKALDEGTKEIISKFLDVNELPAVSGDDKPGIIKQAAGAVASGAMMAAGQSMMNGQNPLKSAQSDSASGSSKPAGEGNASGGLSGGITKPPTGGGSGSGGTTKPPNRGGDSGVPIEYPNAVALDNTSDTNAGTMSAEATMQAAPSAESDEVVAGAVMRADGLNTSSPEGEAVPESEAFGGEQAMADAPAKREHTDESVKQEQLSSDQKSDSEKKADKPQAKHVQTDDMASPDAHEQGSSQLRGITAVQGVQLGNPKTSGTQVHSAKTTGGTVTPVSQPVQTPSKSVTKKSNTPKVIPPKHVETQADVTADLVTSVVEDVITPSKPVHRTLQSPQSDTLVVDMADTDNTDDADTE